MVKKVTRLDALDQLARGDPKEVIALMLWKGRHRNPDLYAQIEEKDLAGFQACMAYQKVTPTVMIKRPQGTPEQPALPATRGRSARPAIPATGPKPFVIVALVEERTENAIKPVENNQADYDVAQDAATVRKARDQAPELARRILAGAQSGDSSLSDIQDAADALITLARAQG